MKKWINEQIQESALLDLLGNLKRTHYAGALRAAHEGHSVVLMGWVARRRDLGNLIFIDLRDREGIAQIVFNKETNAAAHDKAETLRSEFVIAVEGRVVRRGKANPEIATGEVEVVASALHILNTSATPPFVIEDEINASEETRLRYRYLDLRRAKPQANLALRHKVILEIRKAMDELGFYEVETPMLTRATPEGARDYLVPSRVHPGQFYALPQSPQIFKQILMIAGLDRYFQIARCFRDEDLRADRQPDFTQLDVEMSFPTQDDVFGVIEQVMQRAWKVIGVDLKTPFPRLKYKEALARYGTDKPDVRFGLHLFNLTLAFGEKAVTGEVQPPVWGFVVPGGARFSRKQLDELKEFVQKRGANTLYYAKFTDTGIQSPLEKVIGKPGLEQLELRTGAGQGDLLLATPGGALGPGQWHHEVPSNAISELRLHVAEKEGLIPANQWAFLWLTDFPLFEWSNIEKQWVSAQHPFTGIVEQDVELLEHKPEWGRICSKGYDLVLNGVELGSGSIRIHQGEVQKRVFSALGLTDEEARQRFGFFLDALSYGTPPHGGIALGLDRVVMLMAGEKSLREVIAFPKTTAAQDLMSDSPSIATQEQVEELNIIPAFVSLSGHERKLILLNDFLIDLGVTQIFPTLPEAETAFDGFVRGTFVASLRMAKGVVLLGRSGLGHQGQALLRSLLEAGINLEYVFQDRSRADGFWEAGEKSLQKLAKKLGKENLIASFSDQPQSLEQPSAVDKWSRMPLRERANAIGFQWAYDFVYELSSSIIHMDARVAASHQELRPTQRWVGHMLGGCYILMNMISQSVVKAFQLKQFEKTLDEHYQEFQDGLADFKASTGPPAEH